MEIQYNTSLEVTQTQYGILMTQLKGVVCGMKKDSKYFIKVWMMAYVNDVKYVLNTY